MVIERLDMADGAGLFELYGAEMRRAFSLPDTKAFAMGVLAHRGKSKAPAPDADGPADALHGAWIVHAEKADYRLEISLDAHGHITGMSVHDPPAPPPPGARSDVPLGLPFHGEWSVF
jgi:hypothetical protein